MTTDILLSASQKKKRTIWTITTGANGTPFTYADWAIGFSYNTFGSITLATVNGLFLYGFIESNQYTGPGVKKFDLGISSSIDLNGKTLSIVNGSITKNILLSGGTLSGGAYSYSETTSEEDSTISQYNIPYPGIFTVELLD